MNTARFVVRNLDEFRHDMERENAKRIKAGETAAKVEGFRLHKVLKAELRQGRAGGKRFTPLSIIARKLTGYKRRRANARKPLARMAVPVRYRTIKRDSVSITQVGFVDPNRGAKLSKKWVYLAFALQEGDEVPLTEATRKRFLKRGGQLVKGQDPAARFFFIKKQTRSIRIPARPIIDPFWAAHRGEASRNILANFKRKMAGERI